MPEQPFFLEEIDWRPDLRVTVLAPHPDDFDAIAVTLRFFHGRGNRIQLVVISSSASGVEDSFCSPSTSAVKAAIREREQKESCRLFGLPEDRLEFLRLAEDRTGQPLDCKKNYLRVSARLCELRPHLVFLPHGNDTNAGHRLAFNMLGRFATEAGFQFAALLNMDPKTISMRPDLYTFFGEEEARWKAGLLRCHRSQHERNLNTRGYGFDDRILGVNREAAARVPGRGPYAEVFEISCHFAASVRSKTTLK
jgi:LmbE family N-acetylglucosaminyl deacetylase